MQPLPKRNTEHVVPIAKVALPRPSTVLHLASRVAIGQPLQPSHTEFDHTDGKFVGAFSWLGPKRVKDGLEAILSMRWSKDQRDALRVLLGGDEQFVVLTGRRAAIKARVGFQASRKD